MTPSNLRARLEQLALSQVGLARLLGVPGQTVRKWISGQHQVPPTVVRLLLVLEYPQVMRRLTNYMKKGK
jgi:DNA-binding transcriptional regulator YiaG